MAIVGTSYLDIADAMKLTEDGKVAAAVIELLAQKNPMMRDAVVRQANMGAKDRHTVRTGLPTVTWGRLYQGIPQSKSRTQQVDSATGFVEGMSTIDERLLKLGSAIGVAEGVMRLNEASGFIEALNQEMATAIFYSNTNTEPEKFNGFGAHYGVKATSGLGAQIIDAGGTGSDNASIWFITWGDAYSSMIYPTGMKAGIIREDRGLQRVLDSNGNPYYAKEEQFTWHAGLAIKDYRYNVRIANIDMSDLAAGSVNLWAFLRAAYYQMQSRRVPGGRQVIYMNSDVLQYLDALETPAGVTNATALMLARSEQEGRQVLTYRGIPIEEVDALLSTEARVV